MTWATWVPILVFLGLSVLERCLRDIRQTSDRRQTKASLNAFALTGRGIIIIIIITTITIINLERHTCCNRSDATRCPGVSYYLYKVAAVLAGYQVTRAATGSRCAGRRCIAPARRR